MSYVQKPVPDVPEPITAPSSSLTSSDQFLHDRKDCCAVQQASRAVDYVALAFDRLARRQHIPTLLRGCICCLGLNPRLG